MIRKIVWDILINQCDIHWQWSKGTGIHTIGIDIFSEKPSSWGFALCFLVGNLVFVWGWV